MNSKWGKPIFTIVKKVNTKVLLISFVLLFIILFFILNLDDFKTILDGDIDSIRSLLAGNSFYAYLFMLIVMIVQNSFTIVPLILVITINITLFGVVSGFIWSWVTSVIAAILVFILVKFVFQDWLLKRFDSKFLAKVEEKGFTYVFQARIFPFVPTSLVNILAGLSSIKFRHFLFATIFGNCIYFLLLSLIPAGLMSSNMNEYELGIILFLSITLFFGLKKLYNRKRNQSVKEVVGNPPEE